MFKIGLTGNIGSGKSVVAGIFKTFGIPVFDADNEAKKLLKSATVKDKIKLTFGDDIFRDGEIDRKTLANIVFNDKQALEQLNAIIHPEVRNKFDRWIAENKDCNYVIYEAAIIFESGFSKNLDKVILVAANQEIRLVRVMKRDYATREMVLSRMMNQWPDDKKIQLSDFVIYNENQELMIPQVVRLHKKILSLT